MKELSRRMFLGSAAIGSVAALSTGISGTAQAKEVKKEKPWDVIVVLFAQLQRTTLVHVCVCLKKPIVLMAIPFMLWEQLLHGAPNGKKHAVSRTLVRQCLMT